MAAVPWGLPPREQLYMPHTSSPLNPLSTEASLRRQKRIEQCRAVKHEQSPTQRLMRQKAAAAWMSMSARNSLNISHTKATRNDRNSGIPKEHMRGLYPAHTGTGHRSEDKHQDNTKAVRQIDMEKQALADEGYREEWPPDTNCPFRLLSTKRFILIIAILCIIGILSALRVVALIRIQAWRT